jgi:hypothetical protein
LRFKRATCASLIEDGTERKIRMAHHVDQRRHAAEVANAGEPGLTADQVAGSRSWYDPHWHYEKRAGDPRRAGPDLFDHFSRHEPGIFVSLRDSL